MEIARRWFKLPASSMGMEIGNNPWKNSLYWPEQKNSREQSLGFLILTPGPMRWKTIIQNDTYTPTLTALLLPKTGTQTQEKVHQESKWPINILIHNRLLLRHEKWPLKLWNYDTSPHKNEPWRIIQKWTQQQRKKKHMMPLPGIILKRDAWAVIKNTQWGS